jgi:hypothetical protein
MELLSVAQMYKMDVVLTHIRNHIAQQQPPLVRKETAFYVYALAQKYGLRAEAVQAAQCTLSFSTMNIQVLAEEDKLDLMPGDFLHELWKYHQRVRSSLTSDIEEFKASLKGLKMLEDQSCESSDFYEIDTPYWLDHYISSIGRAAVPAFLDFANFHLGFVEHSRGLDSKYGEVCESCSDITEEDLRAFWETLTAVVQGSITKVRVNAYSCIVRCPERGGQVNYDFAVGVEGPMSENAFKAKLSREDSSLPKYLNMPSADVILQSSDLVKFPAHRSVLATSSPFFRDMFTLPQSSSDKPDGPPVIRVSESAEVLNGLISMLYLIPLEMPHSSDSILTLLAATDKYDMGEVQSSVRAEVSRRELLSQTDSAGIFHMYAVACKKRLVPEMEKAARLSLDHPMTFESIGEALRSFDDWALRDLADFRLRCVRSFVSGKKLFSDSQNGPSKIWAGCPFVEHRGTPHHHLPWWLGRNFYVDSRYECDFSKTVPTSVQFREKFLRDLQDHIDVKDCHFC